jgi:outer membrane protein
MFELLIVTVSFGAAQNNRPADPPETTFQAGPGLLITDKAQKGGDTDVLVIPAVYYRQGRFSLFGPQASWVFYYEDGLMVSGIARLRSEGYNDNESRYLRGMSDRRATAEAGLSVAQEFDWGRLKAECTSDVLNEHKGHEIRLLADRRFEGVFGFAKLALTPGIGVNWRSKQLNDYYYGVEGKEATSSRPATNVGSTVSSLASLRVDCPLSDRWNFFGVVSVEWLGSEITDSPIVDQHHRTSVLIGTLYKF